MKVGKDFTTWIKGKISKYEFIENEDYKFCSPKRGSKGRGGHNITDYSLSWYGKGIVYGGEYVLFCKKDADSIISNIKTEYLYKWNM